MLVTGNHNSRQQADREKKAVALSSVLAAVFLTVLKLIVGITTGSLGILAEVAHSGLDLLAAAITFLAVRVSGRPADREHTYGHGKVENLSALFEALLLWVTCIWIIYEAIQRLFFKNVTIESGWWGVLVMAVSVAVNFTRSRALSRVAKKYDSQALEADALHFSTDIWSSAVVIVGLGLVELSERLNVAWLGKADAVAALGVAGIVIYVSLQLGKRAIAELLDAVSPDVRDKLAKAVRVPGVVNVKRLRVRRSGPDAFADVTLRVGRATTLEEAHDIASRAEAAAREVLPGADVVVHVEPVRTRDENVLDTVRLTATRNGLGVHGIRVYDVAGSRSLELHLEVADSLRLNEAHAQATAFEEALRRALPEISQIVTHIEPTGEEISTRRVTRGDHRRIQQTLSALPKELGVDCHPHDVQLHRDPDGLNISFHCVLDASESISDAHALTERIEQALRDRVPGLGRVVIHVEPPGA